MLDLEPGIKQSAKLKIDEGTLLARNALRSKFERLSVVINVLPTNCRFIVVPSGWG